MLKVFGMLSVTRLIRIAVIALLSFAAIFTVACSSSSNQSSTNITTHTVTPTSTTANISMTTPIAEDGTLIIQSSPSGAEIYIDGMDTGSSTPYLGTHISAGNHSIKLTYPHYKWHTEEITINEGKSTNYNWTLDWAPSVEIVIQLNSSNGQDSSIYMRSRDNNYNDSSSLYIGGNFTVAMYRTYVQFNMSLIPPTAVVTDAKIGLHYDYADPQSTETHILVFGVMNDWDEASITWNRQAASYPIYWVDSSIRSYATNDFFYWNLDSSNVQKWIDNPQDNHGIILQYKNENNADGLRVFSSSESDNAANHPKLVIQYYDPAN